VSVRKIQAVLSHPSLLCLPDGFGSLIRTEQKVRALIRSLITECTLTDQETFGMKSQKEGGSGPPRAVKPWKKKGQNLPNFSERNNAIRILFEVFHSFIHPPPPPHTIFCVVLRSYNFTDSSQVIIH
jgi:hypothetical protein